MYFSAVIKKEDINGLLQIRYSTETEVFMKKAKRTIACIMTVVMFLVNSSAVFAAQDGVTGNNVRIISMEEAEQAAIIHIKNVMSTDKESLGNNGVKINVRRAIFDDKNMLECYYFGIKDKDNNHSVVALGYSQFTYSSIGSRSIYIRIADGWTNYPSRYVWGNCQGNWNYVSVLVG